jgi:hypothetical protein
MVVVAPSPVRLPLLLVLRTRVDPLVAHHPLRLVHLAVAWLGRCGPRLPPIRRASRCRLWPGRAGPCGPGPPRRCRLPILRGRSGRSRVVGAVRARALATRLGLGWASPAGRGWPAAWRLRRSGTLGAGLVRLVAVGALRCRRPTVRRRPTFPCRTPRAGRATGTIRPVPSRPTAARSRRAVAARPVARRTTSERRSRRPAAGRLPRPPEPGDQRHDPSQHDGAQHDHRQRRRDHPRADDEHDRDRDAGAEQLRQGHRLGLHLRLLRTVGALGLRASGLRERLRRVSRLRLGLVRLRLGHHNPPFTCC